MDHSEAEDLSDAEAASDISTDDQQAPSAEDAEEALSSSQSNSVHDMETKGEELNSMSASEGTKETSPANAKEETMEAVTVKRRGSIGKSSQAIIGKLQKVVKPSGTVVKKQSALPKTKVNMGHLLKKPAAAAMRPNSAGTAKSSGPTTCSKVTSTQQVGSTMTLAAAKRPNGPLQSKAEPSAATKVSTGVRKPSVATASGLRALSRPTISTAAKKTSSEPTARAVVSTEPQPSRPGSGRPVSAGNVSLSPRNITSVPTSPRDRGFSAGGQTQTSCPINKSAANTQVKKTTSSIPARTPTSTKSGVTPRLIPVGAAAVKRAGSTSPSISISEDDSKNGQADSTDESSSQESDQSPKCSRRPSNSCIQRVPTPRPIRSASRSLYSPRSTTSTNTRIARPTSASRAVKTTSKLPSPSNLPSRMVTTPEKQGLAAGPSHANKEVDKRQIQSAPGGARKSLLGEKSPVLQKTTLTARSATTVHSKVASSPRKSVSKDSSDLVKGKTLQSKAESSPTPDKELQALRLEQERMTSLVPALAITVQHFQAMANSQRQRHANAQLLVDGLRCQLQKMRRELIATRDDQQQLQQMLDDMEDRHEAASAQMASQHQNAVAEIRLVLAEENQENLRDYEKALKVLQANHNENISCLRFAHSQRLAEVQDELDTLRLKYCNVTSQLEAVKAAEAERREAERSSGSTNEADSLRYVLEMKTEEVKKLRQRCNELELQVEQSNETEHKLKALTASKEQLEAQVEMYRNQQQELRAQVASLTMQLEDGQRSNRRLSQTAEELRWRLGSSDFDNPIPNGCSPISTKTVSVMSEESDESFA